MPEPEPLAIPEPEPRNKAAQRPGTAAEAPPGSHSALAIPVFNAATRPTRSARCPSCGYELAGLQQAGTCPECGKAYDKADVYPTPNARNPAACLGKHWIPVGLSILFIPVPMLLLLTVPVSIVWGVVVLFLTPAYGHSLAKEHLHPSQRSRSALRNLRRIGGPWLLTLAIANLAWGVLSALTLIGGLILAGSCLISPPNFH